MTTLMQTYSIHHFRLVATRQFDEALAKILPRPSMVISTGICLAGFGIPLLMAIGMLPVNLLVAAIGLALTALGGVFSLTLCGEI
jgi:hypothetical protein